MQPIVFESEGGKMQFMRQFGAPHLRQAIHLFLNDLHRRRVNRMLGLSTNDVSEFQTSLSERGFHDIGRLFLDIQLTAISNHG